MPQVFKVGPYWALIWWQGGKRMEYEKALTIEQFTDLVKEKYLELGPAVSDKDEKLKQEDKFWLMVFF